MRMLCRAVVRLAVFPVMLLGLGAVEGCRSAGSKGPQAPTAPPDFLKSYVGQGRILRDYGEKGKWSLKAGDLGRSAGPCDGAVEVKEASYTGGTVHLGLSYLGLSHVASESRVRPKNEPLCHARGPAVVTLTGFQSTSASEIEGQLRRLIPSPEEYLNSHGVAFNLAAGKVSGTVADATPSAKSEERTLGRQVSRWPKLLLVVEPWAAATRKVHHEGELEFVGVVGPDGRLHDVKVTTPLAEDQEAQVVRALGLWRFEPARKGDNVVPARVEQRTVFRIE
jgi:hypothetical protein